MIAFAENENSYKCNSYTVYSVLFWIFFTITISGIGASFVYFLLVFKKDAPHIDSKTYKGTIIY